MAIGVNSYTSALDQRAFAGRSLVQDPRRAVMLWAGEPVPQHIADEAEFIHRARGLHEAERFLERRMRECAWGAFPSNPEPNALANKPPQPRNPTHRKEILCLL